MGRVRVNYESRPAAVEIIDGHAHVIPAFFPEQFVLPAHVLKEFCLEALAKIEAWEEAETHKVAALPNFERRYREDAPAA